jgi:hypothetical protein
MPTSSEARTEANRANAQHSTGPRTDAGKQSSSQNAVKHGLNSPNVLIRPGESEAYEQFEANLRRNIEPVGALEEDLFDKLRHAAWNLRRLRQLEESLLLGYDDPFTGEEASRKMNSYARHTARFERVYRNAVRDLRQLQTNRQLAVQATGSGPITITATTSVAKLLKRTQQELKKGPSEPESSLDSDEFSSSQDELEVFIAAHRKAKGANSTAD